MINASVVEFSQKRLHRPPHAQSHENYSVWAEESMTEIECTHEAESVYMCLRI